MTEVYNLLENKELLDSLYGFAYHRTNCSYEAEDLCSDIVLAILKAIRNNSRVSNPYAFIWTIARRVYADYSKERKKHRDKTTVCEFSDTTMKNGNTMITEYLDMEEDKAMLNSIMHQIAFLSKIYRDVCVMYYIDELGISDIAAKLNITETTVKQRLYFSRVVIKKEVKKMNTEHLSLKPVDIAFLGTGNPVGNDPIVTAERSLSKNLLYLCKDHERSIKELSELLHVPMPFIEEEVEIQIHGQNGYYGLLQKTESGKYISNIILVDYDDYMIVNEMYKRNTDIIVQRFDAYLMRNEENILNMPFLNKQTDVRFIAWSLISRINWWFVETVSRLVEEKYFSDITKTKRDFYTFGIATKEGQILDIGFYGCDGTTGNDIGGYKTVLISNIYGKRIRKHFGCGHNISQDPKLLLTIRSIDGLLLSSLTENEKEIAAKAIEEGYIKKTGNVLYPKILVSESEQIYSDIINDFIGEVEELAGPVADEIYRYIKMFVPKHMMNEFHLFIEFTSCGLLNAMIEKCIEIGTLNLPQKTPSAEGVILVVEK